MRRRSILVLAALMIASLMTAAPAVAAGHTDARLTVVHGIPDVPVDIYVNGAKTLENFQPNTVTDPIPLPNGSYEIDIYTAGDGPAVAAMPVLSTELQLPPGGNVTAVAHLTDTGGLALSAFLNDTTTTQPNDARLVVRHLANAPAVDIVANGCRYATDGG